ncbi:hypothetical protein JI435_420120, partial [Parastagonospora nodorum SN15]
RSPQNCILQLAGCDGPTWQQMKQSKLATKKKKMNMRTIPKTKASVEMVKLRSNASGSAGSTSQPFLYIYPSCPCNAGNVNKPAIVVVQLALRR